MQIEDAKMSKSLGNFVTIRNLLADWPGEVLRLNMLKAHYRSPMDWTLRGLEESAKTLDDWYAVAADVRGERPSVVVIEALSDDLNTPQMIAALHGLRNNAVAGNERDRSEFAASLRQFGFLSESAAEWKGRKQQASGVDANRVDSLISARAAALSGAQDSQRTKDAVATTAAVIIFWPAAFLVGGDKQTAAELAQMKGQLIAVEQASIQKNCNIQFQGQRPPGT